MSHSLFVHSTFSNARVWAFLTQVDAAEAQRCRSRGCLYVFCSEHLLGAAQLRPSNLYTSTVSLDQHKRVAGQLRRYWPKTRIKVRPIRDIVASPSCGGARPTTSAMLCEDVVPRVIHSSIAM